MPGVQRAVPSVDTASMAEAVRGRVALTCHQCGAAGSAGAGREGFDFLFSCCAATVQYSRVVVSRIKKGGTPTYVTPTMASLAFGSSPLPEVEHNGGTIVVLLAI